MDNVARKLATFPSFESIFGKTRKIRDKRIFILPRRLAKKAGVTMVRLWPTKEPEEVGGVTLSYNELNAICTSKKQPILKRDIYADDTPYSVAIRNLGSQLYSVEKGFSVNGLRPKPNQGIQYFDADLKSYTRSGNLSTSKIRELPELRVPYVYCYEWYIKNKDKSRTKEAMLKTYREAIKSVSEANNPNNSGPLLSGIRKMKYLAVEFPGVTSVYYSYGLNVALDKIFLSIFAIFKYLFHRDTGKDIRIREVFPHDSRKATTCNPKTEVFYNGKCTALKDLRAEELAVIRIGPKENGHLSVVAKEHSALLGDPSFEILTKQKLRDRMKTENSRRLKVKREGKKEESEEEPPPRVLSRRKSRPSPPKAGPDDGTAYSDEDIGVSETEDDGDEYVTSSSILEEFSRCIEAESKRR